MMGEDPDAARPHEELVPGWHVPGRTRYDYDLRIGDAAAPEQARICLQFTSPTKPALITGSAGDGDGSAPDYRYLVVPLRALASA